ncbi:MAG TPA: aldehyde dehydrogenase family protein, partial [Stellaceae bacterium]
MKLKDSKLFRQQCYVDGKWVDADNRESIPVNNPADNAILGTVPKMGADETRRAIEAAERALPEWRARTGKERAAVLRKLYELMIENQEDL